MTHKMVFLPSGRAVTVPEPGNIALRCGDSGPMFTVPAGVLQSPADRPWGSSGGQAAAWPRTFAGSLGGMRCSASWGACAPAGGEVLA
jgi:hypothetical protein